jgi:hypothetical protein
LIYKGALDLPFADGNVRRQEETDNICVMLNEVVEHLVEPNGRGKPLTEVQSESLRRFFKQGSLAHISGLLRSVYRNVMLKGDGDHLLDGVPVGDQEARIKQGIRHICEHPVWTADLDRDSEMLAVKDMLSTHQNVNGAFTGVVLTLGYALSGKTDQTFKAKWLSGE